MLSHWIVVFASISLSVFSAIIFLSLIKIVVKPCFQATLIYHEYVIICLKKSICCNNNQTDQVLNPMKSCLNKCSCCPQNQNIETTEDPRFQHSEEAVDEVIEIPENNFELEDLDKNFYDDFRGRQRGANAVHALAPLIESAIFVFDQPNSRSKKECNIKSRRRLYSTSSWSNNSASNLEAMTHLLSFRLYFLAGKH